MKKALIAIITLAALTISITSCQKEKAQTPAPVSSSKGNMQTMSGGVTMDMPLTGAYAAWIQNAVITTNPARLDVFINSFSTVEPQHAKLNYNMVNVFIDGLGQKSIGVIVVQNPSEPMDGGIYTLPTGEQYRYGWVLGNNGYWYPGKFWLIGGQWVFFAFDRRDQEINNMYPYDSGIDMDGLAIFQQIESHLKYA